MRKFRIVVAGSRTFTDYNLLEKELQRYIKEIGAKFLSELEIISGTASGADTLGEEFAKKWGISVKRFPADWERFGNSAGYIRNSEMAKYCTHVLLFWDFKSKGTGHMSDLAKTHWKPVKIVDIRKK